MNVIKPDQITVSSPLRNSARCPGGQDYYQQRGSRSGNLLNLDRTSYLFCSVVSKVDSASSSPPEGTWCAKIDA